MTSLYLLASTPTRNLSLDEMPRVPGPLWMQEALCAQTDIDIFHEDHLSRAAKRVCALCNVRSECLDYALIHDERDGVWGGLTAFERLQLMARAS